MPFQWQPYDNSRYSQSIGELMQRKADAQARGVELSGQATAQGINTAAHAIGQGIGDYAKYQQGETDRKLKQTQLEGAQLQVGEAQRNVSVRAALTSAISQTPPLDEGGVSVYDIPAISKRMAEMGFGADTDQVVKHLSGINDAYRAERAAKMAVVQKGAQGIIAAQNDPTLANHFLDTLETNKIFPKEQLDQYRQFIAADPGNVAKLTASLAGPQKYTHAPEGSAIVNEGSGAIVGKVPSKVERPTEASLAERSAQGDPVATDALTKLRPLAYPPVGGPEDYTKTALKVAAEKKGTELTPEEQQAEILKARQQFTQAGHAADPDPPIHLTPEALAVAAKNYAMTGQLPAMGMGKNGANARAQIMNAAGETYKNLDLASQKAAYKANQDSLVKLQGQTDAVTAFEKTAGKNLGMFLDQAKKVIDTGSPWINRPLQTVNKNLLGNEDQPAYEAARMVALTEIAKITSNPALTGQLSDSARQEVSSFVPQGSTLKQIYNVANVLTQDMKNRRDSLNEQIGDIQKRIATPPGGIADEPKVVLPSAGPKDGDKKPIPGYPGTEMTFTNGKWIRTK